MPDDRIRRGLATLSDNRSDASRIRTALERGGDRIRVVRALGLAADGACDEAAREAARITGDDAGSAAAALGLLLALDDHADALGLHDRIGARFVDDRRYDEARIDLLQD